MEKSEPMTKVMERHAANEDDLVVICDFTPPRAGDPTLLRPASDLSADFTSLAYNPGKIPRLNAVMAAGWLKQELGQEVVFTLATRDMNKLALQSLLLGAQLWGLENVVVLQGDPFSEKEQVAVRPARDVRSTELIAAIRDMNAGIDYRGSKLGAPTDFCIGATIDLGRDLDAEVVLSRRKREAGAEFFLLQAVFDPSQVERFLGRYRESGTDVPQEALFCGIQVLTAESLAVGAVPEWVTADLQKGRAPAELGTELASRFVERGFRSTYLIPPILRGGRRDYETAERVLAALRR